MTKEKFIDEYAKKVIENKALAFLGSGINKEVGLPDWDDLMIEFYNDLEIKQCEEISKIDYIDIAQYVINKQQGNKNKLINKIKEKVKSDDKEPGPNLLEIAKLPIKDFWTTNYDNLLEKALDKQSRKHKEIIDKSSFTFIEPNKVNVYKMHGDLNNEKSITIARDDYDNYQKTNLFFWNKFALELSYKSCVFIGTSFIDFNLNMILSKISLLIDEEFKATHYIFFKRKKT